MGIVISSTLILSAAFSVKYKKKLLYMAELNNLRDFLNLLYYASSEINVYEVIMDHILKQRIADRITLFYSQEDSGGDTAWNTLSRGSISFCNIPSSGCPLAENDAAFYVGNLKPCNLRTCRYPELKKGSCTCIPVSHSESSYKFLQFYSRRKKLLPLLIYVLSSHILILRR